MEPASAQDDFGNGNLDHFTTVGILGEGAYGVVYKGIHKTTGEGVALKRIKLDTQSEGVPSTTLREISLLREIDHPNVVKLKDVVMMPDKMYLVFEFIDVDMRKKIEEYTGATLLPPQLVRHYMF